MNAESFEDGNKGDDVAEEGEVILRLFPLCSPPPPLPPPSLPSSLSILSYQRLNTVPSSICKSYKLTCVGDGFNVCIALYNVSVHFAKERPGIPEIRSIE